MTVKMKKDEARQGENRSFQQRTLLISTLVGAVALIGIYFFFFAS